MSGRIAVVFPLPLEPVHLGKDLFQIPEGLRRLGFEPELHCPEATGSDWPLPVIEAGREALAEPDHWRGRELTGAIAFSFLRHSELLEALRIAGVPAVAKGDTTGHVIARAHPRETLDYALFAPPTLLDRVAFLGQWIARMGPYHRTELNELLRAVGSARATVVETSAARDAVAQVLEGAGAPALVERLEVVPNPVAPEFAEERLPAVAEKEKLVVAVGRWDLAVKGASLLAGALERFLARRPDYRAVVAGGGGERVFARAGVDRLEHVGQLGTSEMVALLRRARIVAVSSRWESFSLSSHEGLAMGCSVVGPPLQPLLDIVAAGPYGTLAKSRSVHGLAVALDAEATAWDRGERYPGTIASAWRKRLDVNAVAGRFAELLS
jgi:glycosyltransferase involved in cell wall biosynthesis